MLTLFFVFFASSINDNPVLNIASLSSFLPGNAFIIFLYSNIAFL